MKIILIILLLTVPLTSLAGWKASGLDGKAILCVTVHPTMSGRVLVGVQDEGIYVSNDSCNTWQFAHHTGSVYTITIDRIHPGVVYAGAGGVLLRSLNGGGSFSVLTTIPDVVINYVGLDETQSKAIIVGTSKGVYKSLDQGKTFAIAGLGDHNVTSLAILNGQNKPVIYAAAADAGVFTSANLGVSWAPVGLSEHTIVSLLSDPNDQSKLLVSTLTGGIYQASNKTGQWETIMPVSPSREGCIVVQAVDAELGHTTWYMTSFATKTWKSSDQGKTWQEIGSKLPRTIGLCLGIANIVPAPLYLGTSTGIYRLEDK